MRCAILVLVAATTGTAFVMLFKGGGGPRQDLQPLAHSAIVMIGGTLLIHSPLAYYFSRVHRLLYPEEERRQVEVSDLEILQFLFRCMLYFVAIGICLNLAVTYVSVVYPKIPQVFGGARPRMAKLDLLVPEVSPPTAKLLKLGNDDGAVSQTQPIQVMFVGKATLLINVPTPTANTPGEKLEIARNTVKAIHWIRTPVRQARASPPEHQHVGEQSGGARLP